MTVCAWSSVPSSASSADGLAPISTRISQTAPGNHTCKSVRGRTDVVVADGDLLAVGLVGYAINLLEIVRVGDDLVAGDEVLK
jgi:hypothetical protein